MELVGIHAGPHLMGSQVRWKTSDQLGFFHLLPCRLWDLMREGHGHLADLSGLCCLVLDEADRMMQQGHFQVCVCEHFAHLCIEK